MIDLAKNYSIAARRMKKSVIRELLNVASQPGIISFAGGLPDPGSFPVEEIKTITEEILAKDARSALQYGPTEGYDKLRSALVKWAKREGVHICEDNILITTASQQGLELMSKVFIDPSDPVVVELPSYVGGLQSFASFGANMVGVPIDDEGIRVDILEVKLEDLRKEMEHYKIVYIVPDFQNPAGVTLSLERRKKVIELGKKYEVLVMEDTPYRELRFEGVEPPSLYALDDSDNVVSLHTFSKILVPGLRVGWVVAHPEIIRKLVVCKQSADLCTPNFTQAIAAEFIEKGLLEQHIDKVKIIYKAKKDTMLQALEEFMPKQEGLRWTKPEGGLFLWITLPKHLDADQMFFDAIGKGVAYVTGSAFHCDGRGKNALRVNFSFPSQEEIVEGIRRLAKIIEEKLKKGNLQFSVAGS